MVRAFWRNFRPLTTAMKYWKGVIMWRFGPTERTVGGTAVHCPDSWPAGRAGVGSIGLKKHLEGSVHDNEVGVRVAVQ
jgi:hypothetical protein